MPQILINGKWTELKSLGNGRYSAGGRLFRTSHLPTSILGKNKELVVTPKGIRIEDKSKKNPEYRSAYNPDDIIKGFNALTLGGLNNLSPTLWARRVYDTGKLLNGNMTWSDYTNSWLNGNNGLVSLKFSEEHPYLSTGINLIGDAVALGGISNPNSIKEGLARGKGLIDLSKYGIYDRFQGYRLYNKYLKNNTDNILNLLLDFRFDNGWIKTSDKTGSLFLLPATYTRSEVISSGPTSMRMGFTANPGGRLSRNLVLQGKEAINKLPAGTSISADAHGTSIPSRLSTHKGLNNITRTLFEGVEDSETTLSRMELLLGEEPGSFIRNPYDMSADAHRFFTIEAQKPGRQLVYAGRSGLWNNAAISNPQVYKWQEAYNAGNLSAREYVNNYNNWVKGFGGRPGHVDINGKPYFYHPTIFVTHKRGGKMNILEFLKNGNKIHIKEKNKGKFTKSAKAAGLSVQEHARSVLNDPNATPLLKKRANFARNAAKWHHKQGRIIKAEEGGKSSLWNKIGKALNSDLAQGIISGVGNYALYNLQNKMLNAQVDAQNALNETDYLSSWLDRYKLNLSLLNNKSNIVNQYNAYNMTPYNPPNKINYKASTPSWLNGLNIIGNSVISYYANKKPNTV